MLVIEDGNTSNLTVTTVFYSVLYENSTGQQFRAGVVIIQSEGNKLSISLPSHLRPMTFIFVVASWSGIAAGAPAFPATSQAGSRRKGWGRGKKDICHLSIIPHELHLKIVA